MKIENVSFDMLTESEQDDVPNNGYGKENANYLKITFNKEDTQIYSDAMEPEDASFARDLNWIKYAIEQAYKQAVYDREPKDPFGEEEE